VNQNGQAVKSASKPITIQNRHVQPATQGFISTTLPQLKYTPYALTS